MDELKTKLFENGNTYRIHQDTLRWTLLAGYAAFLVGILSLDKKPDGLIAAGLVTIGICYMFILAVENFFYNLFAEYVKDCEKNIAENKTPRTVRDFTDTECKNIGPFHHSFFFALIVVLCGNAIVASGVCTAVLRWSLYVADALCFLLVFLGWRVFVFPWIVLPLQSIFDVSEPDKNWLWSLLHRAKKKGQ